jgi:hypothetical protein
MLPNALSNHPIQDMSLFHCSLACFSSSNAFTLALISLLPDKT